MNVDKMLKIKMHEIVQKQKKFFSLLVLLLILFVPMVFAAPTVTTDRPRLLFTPDDLPGIKDRLNQNDDLSQSWEETLERLPYGSSGRYFIPIHGFAYQVEGDTSYSDRAIQLIMSEISDGTNPSSSIRDSSRIKTVAFGFDWTYDELSTTQRNAIADWLVEAMDDHGHCNKGFFGNGHLGAFGGSVAASLTLIGVPGYEQAAQDKWDEMYECLQGDLQRVMKHLNGGYHESPIYNQVAMYNFIPSLRTISSATDWDIMNDEDGYKEFFENNGKYMIYTTRPDCHSTSVGDIEGQYHYNENPWCEIGDKDRQYLTIYATEYQDGYVQELIEKYSPLIGDYNGYEGTYFPRMYIDYIFYDSDLNREELTTLPKSKLFEGIGQAFLRSGWEDDDTMISYKCGDYFSSHVHLDQGNFEIYKEGLLAVDSGLYHANGDWNVGHHAKYYTKTIAHNTITVKDPNQEFYSSSKTLPNDGGQRNVMCLNDESWLEYEWGCTTANPTSTDQWFDHPEWYNTCDITANEFTDDFDYIKSDLLPGYVLPNDPNGKVTQFDRELIFIKPDIFIIFDRVNSRNADFEKKWLLHSWNEPEINGDNINTEVENHIETYNGNEVIIEENGGKLFSKTLYPINSNIRKVGGDGYEFWVDDNGNGQGENYPVTDWGYDYAWNNGDVEVKDAGQWRIEVIPSQAKEFDNFLHAMYITESSTSQAPESVLIEESNALGVMIDDNVVIFGKMGEIDSVGYEIETSSSTNHIIANLESSTTYTVSINNNDNDYTSTQAGILIFEDTQTGVHTISVGGGVPLPKCNDGTLYNSCSAILPKYCDEGTLADDCNSCGCNYGDTCENDGTCKTSIACTDADTSAPIGEISNLELKNYITLWINGDVTISNLFDVIDKWKNDC
jgi:hypothetical protein